MMSSHDAASADAERSATLYRGRDGVSTFWAVIPAAGHGTRMAAKQPKQYLPLAGSTVIERTIEIFVGHPRCRGVVVAVASDDPVWPTLVDQWGGRVITVQGGEIRARSVLAGLYELNELADSRDWILVHDAARPCLAPTDVDRLLDAVGEDDNGGLLALPTTDTLKQVDEHQRVRQTVPRHDMWRALTPQMFRLRPLVDAIEGALWAHLEVTDEAIAMEHAGYRPQLIAATNENLKITRPPDLERAAQILEVEPV